MSAEPTLRQMRETDPADVPPRVNPAPQRGDIDVTATKERALSNPAFMLGMRTIGAREHSFRSVLLSRHWLFFAPMGPLLGLSLLVQAPAWTPMLAAPVALIYYVFMSQTEGRFVIEMKRRRLFHDIYLIPFLDPIEMGAGLALVGRFQKCRLRSAALFFAGSALMAGLVADQSARVLSDRQTSVYGWAGGALLVLSALYAQAAAVGLRGHFRTTFREIREALQPLKTPSVPLLSRSVWMWAATFGVVALSVLGFRYINDPRWQALATFGAPVLFIIVMGLDFSQAPAIDEARQDIFRLMRRAL